MQRQKPEIIIVTGAINSGKSKMLTKMAKEENGRYLSGIIARGVFKDNTKIGFDVIDLASNICMPLARTDWNPDKSISVGKYIFDKEAFDFARHALLRFKPDGVVFLDEAGPLELIGEGYADCLITLLESPISRLYVAVRSGCLEDFKKKYVKGNSIRIIECDNL